MIDWEDNVRRFHTLGIWHAVQYLKGVATVKDPTETAHDVVQNAWLTLWKKQKFTKGLFVAVVMGLASNAARDTRPIELVYKRGGKSRKNADHLSRLTGTFPVQIFATTLDEVTMEQDVKSPHCGDE